MGFTFDGFSVLWVGIHGFYNLQGSSTLEHKILGNIVPKHWVE